MAPMGAASPPSPAETSELWQCRRCYPFGTTERPIALDAVTTFPACRLFLPVPHSSRDWEVL